MSFICHGSKVLYSMHLPQFLTFRDSPWVYVLQTPTASSIIVSGCSLDFMSNAYNMDYHTLHLDGWTSPKITFYGYYAVSIVRSKMVSHVNIHICSLRSSSFAANLLHLVWQYKFETRPDSSFKRLFVGFTAVRNLFKIMRNISSIDATHIRNNFFEGVHISATIQFGDGFLCPLFYCHLAWSWG